MIKNYVFNSGIEVKPGRWGVWGWDFINEESVEVIGFRCEDRSLKRFDWGYGEYFSIERQTVVNKGSGWQTESLADEVEQFEELYQAENFLKEIVGDEAEEDDREAIAYELVKYETEDGEFEAVEVLEVKYLKK